MQDTDKVHQEVPLPTENTGAGSLAHHQPALPYQLRQEHKDERTTSTYDDDEGRDNLTRFIRRGSDPLVRQTESSPLGHHQHRQRKRCTIGFDSSFSREPCPYARNEDNLIVDFPQVKSEGDLVALGRRHYADYSRSDSDASSDNDLIVDFPSKDARR